MKRTVIGSILAIAVVMLAGYIFIDMVFSGMCGNDIVAQLASPDKKHRAVLFQRDCGATTGFSTQVSILNERENLENSGGNILIADDHPNNNRFELSWVDSRTLLIKNTKTANALKKEGALGSIVVRYE